MPREEGDGRANPASHTPASMQPPATVTGVAPWARPDDLSNPSTHTPTSMQPPATMTGVAPWSKPNAALHARLDAAGKRDPRGVPNPRIKSGRPPRPPPSLGVVGEAETPVPQPLPAFDANTAANNPTDWEDVLMPGRESN